MHGDSEFFCRTFLQKLRTVQGENSEILREFAFRLNMRAERMGITQKHIADKIVGGKTPRVSNWFKARNFPRAREKVELASLLKVRPEWLYRGEGSPEEENSETQNLPAGASSVREVPVISWTHAGAATSYAEMPKHWHGTVATTSRDKKAFALTIEGDCMEPKFFAGDRVILEPTAEPRTGKPVVAKFVDSEEVQIRIFTQLDKGRVKLTALNPIYPPKEYPTSAFSWIYPVRELVRSV